MDFGHVQGFQSRAYDTVSHYMDKATECAICMKAHLIGTDLNSIMKQMWHHVSE